MSLTTTAKSSTADSYISATEADTLLAGHPDLADWSGLSTTQKEHALKWAAKMLNQFNWQGSRTDDDQALAWPRTDVYYWEDEMIYGWLRRERIYSYYDQGNELDNDTIPADIKMAQALFALQYGQDDDLADLKSVNMGGMSITRFGNTSWGKEIRAYIVPYLKTRNTNVVGLMRA